jgi:hypothetical protein
MSTTIGTCGHCGGRVAVPSPWFSVLPAEPTCESCGRKPRDSWGKRIIMDDPPKDDLQVLQQQMSRKAKV